MLEKTAVDDVDNSILLLFRHLVIGRQTESAPENISPNVNTRTSDIGVRSSSAVTLYSHESVCSVNWLEVHGLPDGTAFGIECGDGIQNLLRRTLTADALV